MDEERTSIKKDDTLAHSNRAVRGSSPLPGAITFDCRTHIDFSNFGRKSYDEITVFDSTGLAVQDIATDWVVYEKAKKMGKGMEVELL